jgi:hypothetical protein
MTDRLHLQFAVAAKLHDVYSGHAAAAWMMAGEWISQVRLLDEQSVEQLFLRCSTFNRDVRRRLDDLAASIPADEETWYLA